MVESSYWQSKISRRRLLATGTASGAGFLALTLVSCAGGSSSKAEKPKLSTSRITTPSDSSAQAKRGGIYQGAVNQDEASWDPLSASRTPDAFEMTYSRLIKQKETIGVPATADYEGDLAQSWELSPDNTRITFKMRPGAKWDQRAPTSSRQIDADDVVYSWKKWEAASPTSQELANSKSPIAPILSVEKIDNMTVAFKMAYPWSPLLAVMSTTGFFIQPREAEDKFNPKTDIRASGPWFLAEYQPSAYMHWRKNPNWYNAKDLPYLDGYDTPIVTEYAARLAQFRAKNVWDLTAPLPKPSDVVDLAKALPEVQLFELPRSQQVWHIDMGARPGSPYADRRVRQAMSMALDRELFAQTDSQNDILEPAGLGRDLTLCTMISDAWGDMWLDPKTNKLGDGAKFFQKNIAEAKKLMSAAGVADGFETTLNSRGGLDPGEPVLAGMLSDIGIRSKTMTWTSPNYLTQVAYPYNGSLGNFDGWASRGSVSFNPSVMSYLQKVWTTQGRNPGTRIFDGDEQKKIDSLIEQGLKTFDEKQIKDLVQQMQKLQAVHLSTIPFWYNTGTLSVGWPWARNRNVFQYRVGNPNLQHVWIDDSKKTS